MLSLSEGRASVLGRIGDVAIDAFAGVDTDTGVDLDADTDTKCERIGERNRSIVMKEGT